ncbi:MAG TPA: helix-turn-helix domain-containing protein [Kofleriaceae bacterium]|nr:helix-turn-helix domain-containing protein [Kofleriaceae bacterium]
MLSASSTRTFNTSTLKSTIFLERRLRAHLVSRDRLLYDSAYAPPAKKSSAYVHLFAQLRGTFAISDGTTATAPCAFILAESEFDRVGPGSMTFRSSGAPGDVIELRLLAPDFARPIGLAHGQLELPPAVWDAYFALADAQTEAALHVLVDALVTANVVARDLPDSIVTHEPERYTRIWTTLKPFYHDLAMSTSLKQIAVIAGLSLRQLGRDLGDFTRDFGLFGGGFRDASRVLRLRAAVLFLSAPGATPSEVAKAVGYGSLDAMGRAFRDAKLPAPSVVQDAVRYRDV